MRWAWVLPLAFGCAAPVEVDDEPRIVGLIEALGDDDVEVRTLAEIELRRLGPLAEPRLRDHAMHPDVEVASRCERLLRAVEPRLGDAGTALVSKIVFVDRDALFVAIAAGRAEGTADLRFEIRRGARWIATARFEKYLANGSLTKLRITAGKAVDIRLDDEAVGF